MVIIRHLLVRFAHLDPESITPETEIRNLVKDSLKFVEFIIFLEDELDVAFQDPDIDKLITVQDLADYLKDTLEQLTVDADE